MSFKWSSSADAKSRDEFKLLSISSKREFALSVDYIQECFTRFLSLIYGFVMSKHTGLHFKQRIKNS